MRANTSLLGVIAGAQNAEEVAHIHPRLSALIADGRLHDGVTDTFAFSELPVALQRIADRAVIGKLVLVPGGRHWHPVARAPDLPPPGRTA